MSFLRQLLEDIGPLLEKAVPAGTKRERSVKGKKVVFVKGSNGKWARHKGGEGEQVSHPQKAHGPEAIRSKSYDPWKDYDGNKAPTAKPAHGPATIRSKSDKPVHKFVDLYGDEGGDRNKPTPAIDTSKAKKHRIKELGSTMAKSIFKGQKDGIIGAATSKARRDARK